MAAFQSQNLSKIMDNSNTPPNSKTTSLFCTNSELDVLQELCTTIIQSINMAEFLQTLIERAGQILEVKSGSIVMPDMEGLLRIKAYFGFRSENAEAYVLKPNEGRGGKIFTSGEPQIFVTNDQELANFHQITTQEQLKHTIGAPMIDSSKRVIGVLFLNDKKSGEAFNQRDLKLLENLANLAAIAVEKQVQLEELNRQKENYRHLSECLEHSLNQLNLVNERLRDSNKLKDEVLSICAHDVRSPLTAIISYAELLLTSGSLNDKQQRYLSHIHRSSEKINNLVQNLLVRARYLESNVPLRLESVSISRIAQEAIQQIEDRLATKKVQATIRDNFKKLVRADRFKLAQVIDNLIDNAIKFTPENKEITIDISHDPLNLEQIIITITNQGQGIPADALPKLFARYFQVSTHKPQGGYGLGLAICKQNVEAHSGEITVESKLNEYTSFTFNLPIGKPYLLTLSSNTELINKISQILPAEEKWVQSSAENDKILLDMVTSEVPTILVIDADVGELNLSVLVSLLRKEFDPSRLAIVIIGDNEPIEELETIAYFLPKSFTLQNLLATIIADK
ncbi:MAG: GAF domain-containing protein [Acidobacteria bacterium]|nr:GAF domain-containing protein [Acidobacteriota bacterium]